MHKCEENFEIAGFSGSIFLPDDYEQVRKYYPVIYINGEAPVKEILSQLMHHGQKTDFIIVSIKPSNWNDDFTPWNAPAFRPNEAAPLGNGHNYINILTNKVKSFVDENFRTRPMAEDSILLGYSLGGLTALYALYQTDVFGKIGSLSGSLWYDNWISFMETEKPAVKDAKVYLSLGKQEIKSRNVRMAKVGECTERATEILKEQLGSENVVFDWNNGGHFTEIPQRFAKAIRSLI